MAHRLALQFPTLTLARHFRMAARNIVRQRRRSAMALLTVCGGVVAILLAGGFVEWVFSALRDSTIHSQLGHIQVTRPGYFRQGIADPYNYLLPAEIAPEVQEGRGHIVSVAPRLAFSGLLGTGESSVSFIGEGIDPVRERQITRALKIVSGRDLRDNGDQAAVLGRGLASALGVKAGDRVVLLVNAAAGGVNAVELEVAGVFSSMIKAYDDSALRVPVDIARKLLRVDGATSWVLLLDDHAHTTVEANRLKREARDVEVTPWYDMADFYNKTVGLFSRQLGVVQTLIGLIVVLTITNTLAMAVRERTGEIGTILATGSRRREVLSLFVCEGALLGLFGGILGLILGAILAAVISAIGIPMPAAPGMTEGYTGEILITPALGLQALLLAAATTTIASIVPAMHAARMNIVDALRHAR